MGLLVSLIRWAARTFDFLGSRFLQVSSVLNGLLPVLLSPQELSALVRTHYRSIYPEDSVEERLPYWAPELTPGEVQLFDRYHVRSGRMLILGSGSGREAIALTHRGVTVIGVDSNPVAVRIACHLAGLEKATAYFHVGNFLDLPYAPARFDFAYQSSSMFSSIAGSAERRAWLRALGRVLRPHGVALLDFYPEPPTLSRLARLSRRLNRWLARLPGTNPAYQPGDQWPGHFLHAFQNEDELRRELTEAGARIRELNWVRGLVVVDFPSPAPQGTAP